MTETTRATVLPEMSTDDDERASRRTPVSHTPKPLWRRPWIIPLVTLVVVTLSYLLAPYVSLNPAEAIVTLDTSFPLHYPVLIAHIATGTIALVTVCAQVWPWILRRHPTAHRISGRLYVFAGAVPCALLLLVLVPLMPEWRASVGTVMHGLLWLATTVIGYAKIRRGRYAEHRRWMLYSFGLALGITWGLAARMVFPLLPFAVELDYLFEIARWFGWVANLMLVQWWLERKPVPAIAKGTNR